MDKVCHGCDGKGWVAVDGKPYKCPVCNGTGKVYVAQKDEPLTTTITYPTWYPVYST